MREAKPTWTRCIRRFLDTAYAPRCGLCAVLGEGGICSVCFSDFEPFPAGDEEEGRGEMSPHVRSTAIAFRYEGRATRSQAGLTLEERRTNLRGAFRASAEVKGASLVLVDDVRTSGATAIECARTLLEAGAIDVSLLAFSGA